jgi:hypothetical protein
LKFWSYHLELGHVPTSAPPEYYTWQKIKILSINPLMDSSMAYSTILGNILGGWPGLSRPYFPPSTSPRRR